MSPELDDSLCAKYPSIFAERNGDPATTSMCWGFEIGDGWFTLIDVLCAGLQRETDERGAPQVIASQVKQKAGGLRFHVDAASDRQRAMIELAQDLSRQLCEACGAPGTTREASPRKIEIRCAACHADEL
jgi:hypothetical protein